MQAPLEVCGLPHAVPNGLHLGERATLFNLTLALGMAGDVGRSREEAEPIRNKKLGIANFRPLAPAGRWRSGLYAFGVLSRRICRIGGGSGGPIRAPAIVRPRRNQFGR